MTTSSATRSIEINAPVDEVFAFVSDPKKLLEQTFPLRRRVTVSDVTTTPEGAVTGFRWSTRFVLLPVDFRASCTRQEQIADERIVDKYSTGDLSTFTFERSGGGTRLTNTIEITRRIPLLDRLEIVAFMLSNRMDRGIDQQLGLIKQRVEGGLEGGQLVERQGRWGVQPPRGTFPNGMRYARFGAGPKTLLWLSAATKGPMLAMMARVVRPFVADGYSVWLVSGRPNMPAGHTLADMAGDYAALVDEEFGGRVDLVIGHSTGGFVGFALAAGHPDRFGRIVIAGAALWGQRADEANLEFSRLLVAGRTCEAGEHAVRTLAPGIRVPGLATMLGVLLARASLTQASAEDLLVAAEALHAFDPQQVLPSIGVPVLLVVGDKDPYSTPEEIEEAAELIPSCTLRLYPDTNHFGAILSPRFAADAREFIARTQQAPAS